MAKQLANNVRLGIFVIAGLLLLVFALYMIGQNQSFFGSNFTIKTRFRNVNGLMPGNNVRFSGIQCGTVKSIEIIHDTSIEVTMLINSKTSRYIRQNALVDIGNEGLMGNKVVNIEPGSTAAPQIEDGGTLQTLQGNDLNDMIGTLSVTNDNVADISEKLKEVVNKLNDNPVLWRILNDTTIPDNLQRSIINIRNASASIDHAAQSVDRLMTDVQNGAGAAGILFSDKEAADNLSEAISHIRQASEAANGLVGHLDSLVLEVHGDLDNGTGVVHSLLKDPEMVRQLNSSLDNIEKGTAAFNEDMEALKHNFLLRGYFRKQEKKLKKQQ